MSTPDDQFIESLRATFRVEADEHLQTISTTLLNLEKSKPGEEQRGFIDTAFRAAHSLKGAARAVNMAEIETICQSMEDMFAAWKRQDAAPSTRALDTIHRALDAVTAILAGGPQAAACAPAAPPAFEQIATEPPARSDSGFTERSSGDETVRISVAKLDARLVEAEEMLAAKLATGQRATDLRELSQGFEDWTKEWAAVQSEVRPLRQSIERSGRGEGSKPGLRELVAFLDWNQDYMRSFEARLSTLTRRAEQDRMFVGKLVDDLLEDSKKLLMLPLSTQVAFFHKLVRDLCRDQGKEADLVVRGEEFEIDKRILEEMKDPLIHIIRNAIDHGLESPEEREHFGKRRRGTITLTITPTNGSHVELLVSDDGAGIDDWQVRDAAVQRGTISRDEAQQLSETEALNLIFRSDVSTSRMITQLSGRGLGLAIVREKTDKLGGRVTVDSRRDQGTTFRITLPITLSTFRGILVGVAGRLFVIPTVSVECVSRFRRSEVQTVKGRETLSLNGRAVALARLADILEVTGNENEEDADGSTPILVLGKSEERVAFAVDEIRGEEEVLVKRLKKPLSRVRNVAGATVLGSGQIAVILNVPDLLKSARKVAGTVRRPAGESPAETVAKSVLIAEDSITSRMLLKGILESAGYRVRTAVDGAEAFAILRSEAFDIIVSDVEMPRMNGFELTERIRADKKLANLPVVLLTALENREDKERGVDVGANAYLIKSSFDQSNLLEAIRRLS